MNCEEICRPFWREGEEKVCQSCQPFMRALLVRLCTGINAGQGKPEAADATVLPREDVQKVVTLDEEDSMIEKLEWNTIVKAMDALGRCGIPGEQVETIELILTEVKRRGTL